MPDQLHIETLRRLYVPVHPERRVTPEPDSGRKPHQRDKCVLCHCGPYRFGITGHGLPAHVAGGGTTATFTLAGFPAHATATVIGENLTVDNLPIVGDVAGYITVCGGSSFY